MTSINTVYQKQYNLHTLKYHILHLIDLQKHSVLSKSVSLNAVDIHYGFKTNGFHLVHEMSLKNLINSENIVARDHSKHPVILKIGASHIDYSSFGSTCWSQ